MNLEDIDINIKTYDKNKNHVIVNLTFLQQIEVRGYIVRYRTTKYSSKNPVWIVTPPSTGKGVRWFHIVRIKNSLLWEQIQKRIIELVKEYTNLV